MAVTNMRRSEGFASTKVLFPRFQRETTFEAEYHKRNVEWMAEERAWLLKEEADPLIKPNSVVDEYYEKRKFGWWGIRHIQLIQVSLGRLFDPIFDDDPARLFRSVHIHHDYLWDHQAFDGYADEVILQRLNDPSKPDLPAFSDVAALLIHQHRWNSPVQEPAQRFMMRDASDEWVEPVFGQPDDLRDRNLLILGELATRVGHDPLPKS